MLLLSNCESGQEMRLALTRSRDGEWFRFDGRFALLSSQTQ